jgi:hypothetical protein
MVLSVRNNELMLHGSRDYLSAFCIWNDETVQRGALDYRD